MKKLFAAALVLAIAPPVAVIVIFVAWSFFRFDWLFNAGLYTACAGGVLTAICIVCLPMFLWFRLRANGASKNKADLTAVCALVVYLISFSTIAAIPISANYTRCTYKFWITNQSEIPFDSVSIHIQQTNESAIEVGTIEPGKTIKQSYGTVLLVDGIWLHGSHGQEKISKEIHRESDRGRYFEIELNTQGELTVNEIPPGILSQ